MVGYSVIVPHCGSLSATTALAQSLRAVLAELARPSELVVVAARTSRSEAAELRDALQSVSATACWRLAAGRGIDAAVLAAVQVCRYEVVVAIDPLAGYSALDVPKLLDRLARHDLVVARAKRIGWRFHWERLSRALSVLPRHFHTQHGLFWAARREALPSGPVPSGALRRLPAIVARRGYRVDEVSVSVGRCSAHSERTRQHPLDIAAAWWLAGREHRAHCEPVLESSNAQLRFDGAHPRPLGPMLQPTRRSELL